MFSLQTSLSWKMLWENKLRFFFSILGIAISIALIFIIQGFRDGLLRQIKVYPLNSGADIFVSQEGVDSLLLGSSILSSEIKINLSRTSGVEEVADIITSMAMFAHHDEKTPVTIIGYDQNKTIGGPWILKEGRLLTKRLLYKKLIEEDLPAVLLKKQLKPKEVIFDYTLAKSYGLNIGDIVEIQDYDFEIIGFSGETTSWITSPIFMSRESARDILKTPPNFTSYFLVKVKEGYDPKIVKDEIFKRSADYSRISDLVSGIEVFTAQELAQKDADFTEELFISMMGVITILSFLIGILIIGLTIYILALEKLRDFAILKAVGTTNRQVYKIVIIQTIISTFLGFILGLLIALGLDYLTTQILTTQFIIVVERSYIWAVLGGSFIMALLAAYIPIRKVFQVEPTLVFGARQY